MNAHRLFAATTIVVLVGVTQDLGAAHRPTVALVTNANPSGPGSFAAAIGHANADKRIKKIQFVAVPHVALGATAWFTGSQNLTIIGGRVTLDAAGAGGPALRITGGGDVTLENLTVSRAPSDGVVVDVPHYATGTIHARLEGVVVQSNAGHGVLIDDQDDPATAELDGDSMASVHVSVVNSRFFRNGYSVSDRDGLRVNEGGDGHLSISLQFVRAEENGADGIEVDERGKGDVRVDMFGSQVNANGRFDPADLDDGFDIDESDDGSIIGRISLSSANDNFEEGFDFNENHAGDLRVDMLLVEASRNGEEGIDYEEDDDFAGGGDLVTTMTLIRAEGNRGGDAGLKIREKGAGDLDTTISGVDASRNLTGGISIREDANGTLLSSIEQARTIGNSGHGVDFDENRLNAGDLSGRLTATLARSVSSNNGNAGVRADSPAAEISTLSLQQVILASNAGGPTGGNVVPVIVP